MRPLKDKTYNKKKEYLEKKISILEERLKNLKKPHPKIMSEELLLVDRVNKTESCRNWRIKVFERDNFTCTVCHKKGRQKLDFETDQSLPILYAVRRVVLREHLKKIGIADPDFAYQAEMFPELWRLDAADTICNKCFNSHLR